MSGEVKSLALVFDPATLGKVELKEFPAPTLSGDDDVLVEVYAASLNPFDNLVINYNPMHAKAPAAIGVDFSGVVRAVGKAVGDFKVGDEVFGAFTKTGALATYTVVDSSNITLKPKALSWAQAAALGCVFITAVVGIEEAKIQSGETVFVPGGGGGVSHLAVQLAKLAGARVITSASNKDALHFLKDELKLDYVFDYKAHNTADEVKKFTSGKLADVVLDNVGDVVNDSAPALRKNGRYFALETPKLKAETAQQTVEAHDAKFTQYTGGGAAFHPDRAVRKKVVAGNFKRAAELAVAGKLKIKVSKNVALEGAAAALAETWKGGPVLSGFGKTVVILKA